MGLMRDTSEKIIGMHKDPRKLLTAALSELSRPAATPCCIA